MVPTDEVGETFELEELQFFFISGTPMVSNPTEKLGEGTSAEMDLLMKNRGAELEREGYLRTACDEVVHLGFFETSR